MKASRIEKEKRTVSLMIRLYCQKIEGNKELCEQCRELETYAMARLSHCRYGEQKHACKYCPTHCYKPIMRERIRVVMRKIGPRMLFYAPKEAICHLLKL